MPRMTDPESPDQNDDLAAFETAMNELESLVESLESGEIGLEESLARFEKGVALARRCQAALKGAELRVEQLLENDQGGHLGAFEDPED